MDPFIRLSCMTMEARGRIVLVALAGLRVVPVATRPSVRDAHRTTVPDRAAGPTLPRVTDRSLHGGREEDG